MIIAAPRTTTMTTNPVRTRSNIIQLSATSYNNNNHYTLQSSSTTTLRTKAKRVITNLHRIRTIFLHQLSNVITHKKFKLVMLSTMLAITTALVPQCAVAKSSSLFSSLSSSSSSGGAKDTKTSIIVVPSSSGSSSSSNTMKKVGKVVVTIGAIGAGASTANVMRSKLFACSGDGEDQEEDDNESVVVNGKKSKEEESPINGSVQTMNKGATNNNSKAEIEPLSEEWIQQQLNDAEKRSNVLNDVIKMTQSPQSQSTVAAAAAATTTKVTKNTNGTTKSSTKVNGNSRTTTTNKKKVSVDNTIGIQSPTKSTTTTTTPLVKNLDSKIEMLQRREAERTKEQQRINDEQAQVQMEQKKVAIVEAQQKIELAEKEYRQRSQLQQQVVVEDERKDDDAMINSTPSSTTTTRLAIKVVPGGSPAKSKEEDLELTTQVILEHVNSMDSMSHGVVDDDDDE